MSKLLPSIVILGLIVGLLNIVPEYKPLPLETVQQALDQNIEIVKSTNEITIEWTTPLADTHHNLRFIWPKSLLISNYISWTWMYEGSSGYNNLYLMEGKNPDIIEYFTMPINYPEKKTEEIIYLRDFTLNDTIFRTDNRILNKHSINFFDLNMEFNSTGRLIITNPRIYYFPPWWNHFVEKLTIIWFFIISLIFLLFLISILIYCFTTKKDIAPIKTIFSFPSYWKKEWKSQQVSPQKICLILFEIESSPLLIYYQTPFILSSFFKNNGNIVFQRTLTQSFILIHNSSREKTEIKLKHLQNICLEKGIIVKSVFCCLETKVFANSKEIPAYLCKSIKKIPSRGNEDVSELENLDLGIYP